MTDHTLRDSWTTGSHPIPDRQLRLVPGLSAPSLSPLSPSRLPSRRLSSQHVEAPPSRLPTDAQAALSAIVGPSNVLTDAESRLGRSGGMSYVDLLRRRSGCVSVPDAVVLPADPAEVTSVLVTCARLGVAVVPFGGGTSVVGGVTAACGTFPTVIVIDLMHLDKLVSVDPMSRVAVFQAGVRGPDAERMLAAHGLTLGHIPQSFERATIGGFAATRSAGQASSGYGRFEDMVVGLRVATPRGEWRLGVAPASAAGPDLRALVVGSEGAFGIITEVTVRVRPIPTHHRYEAYVVDGWASGVEAMRALAQSRFLATVTRLSDMDETSMALASSSAAPLLRTYLAARGVREPCLLVLGWEAEGSRELSRMRAATLRVLRRHHPVHLGRSVGEAWRSGRFAGPRQRDALLDAGACVETLETATFWSSLTELRDAVRIALSDALTTTAGPPFVMCHVSHAYETGASLYFTVLTPRSKNDPVAQWQRAKKAASEAITKNHLGTITHHHAIGMDHVRYLTAEIGDLGVEVLTAVKNTLDPTNTLNPTKLIPTPNNQHADA